MPGGILTAELRLQASKGLDMGSKQQVVNAQVSPPPVTIPVAGLSHDANRASKVFAGSPAYGGKKLRRHFGSALRKAEALLRFSLQQ